MRFRRRRVLIAIGAGTWLAVYVTVTVFALGATLGGPCGLDGDVGGIRREHRTSYVPPGVHCDFVDTSGHQTSFEPFGTRTEAWAIALAVPSTAAVLAVCACRELRRTPPTAHCTARGSNASRA